MHAGVHLIAFTSGDVEVKMMTNGPWRLGGTLHPWNDLRVSPVGSSRQQRQGRAQTQDSKPPKLLRQAPRKRPEGASVVVQAASALQPCARSTAVKQGSKAQPDQAAGTDEQISGSILRPGLRHECRARRPVTSATVPQRASPASLRQVFFLSSSGGGPVLSCSMLQACAPHVTAAGLPCPLQPG